MKNDFNVDHLYTWGWARIMEYAEGIIGFSIPIINFNKFTLSTPIQMVVAGGGGIDVWVTIILPNQAHYLFRSEN